MSRAIQQIKVRFDWVLLLLVMSIATVGLLNLYSSSVALGESFYLTQMTWLSLGFGLALVTTIIDYRTYERLAYVGYVAVVVMLIAVLIVGTTINGSRRWLNLGFTLLQPSELMKLAMILVVARFYADRTAERGYTLKDLALPFGLVSIPALLIMLQPDLGTALVVIFIVMTLALFMGIEIKSLVTMGISGAIALPLFWFFGLRGYQKERITSFLDLEGDHHGAGWQVRQALIAFGSGGWTGKGQLAGTQIQMGFVPYHESDFAAVNWAEEHGFLGMLLLLTLFVLLLAWSMRIARNARDRFGMVVALGVAALIFWHVVINLCMVLGLMPVVGLTLPLVSYGGSSVITFMLGLGLLMNVSLRRHVF